MKKFGISKKDKGADDASEDLNRSRLFGSKSKPKGSPAPSANPYAVPQSTAASDPYAAASPYANTSSSGGGYGAMSQNDNDNNNASSYSHSQSPPPAYQNSSSGYGSATYSNDPMRNDKSPVPPGGYTGNRYGAAATGGGYGSQQGYGASDRYGGNGYGGGGYADNPYGGSNGSSNRYGDNSYGNKASSSNTASSGYQRPGGYGGLGRSQSNDAESVTEARKDALFGNAKERYQEREAQNTLPPEEDPNLGYASSRGGGDADGGGYGSYQNRQLTAEEEEEEDVQAAKQQIRAIKQQDVSSTRNALRIAEQAEQTGRETLERLGQQGERIHNTERNLDLASNQNRLAEEKARELKHLNRSMWAMRVGNPFTKARRERQQDEAIMSQHQSEREERQATRQAAFESQMRKDEQQRELRGVPIQKKSNLAERSKYQFEADSEDEAMEDEIDGNLDSLHGAAGRLHQLGLAMGQEVDSQNKHIDRIVGKADRVDDQIVMNRSRLDRIR